MVQRLLAMDTRAAPGNGEVYPLSGLVVCGGCGMPIIRKTTKAGGKTYSYYICATNKATKECSSTVCLRMTKQVIAIYLRLSGEDKDIGKNESNSIANQRQLILDYIRSDKTLSECEIREFVDDGDRLDENVNFMFEIVCTWRKTIRNIKQYLRAALFNAPSTIGNYYTFLVAYDMASGALAPKEPHAPYSSRPDIEKPPLWRYP